MKMPSGFIRNILFLLRPRFKHGRFLLEEKTNYESRNN